METLLHDLRFGFRMLRKAPGFTMVAVVVLALGIGANTAIFSVVNAILLRPLPFQDPERLVQVWHVPPPKSFPGMTRFAVSPANYLDWERQNRVFENTAIYGYRTYSMTGSGEPESVSAIGVSPDFFRVLRIQPSLGRVFLPEENQNGRGRVAVLSEAFWQTHFASDPNIVGRTISLDSLSYTVVGVIPSKSIFPTSSDPKAQPQLWTPLAWTDAERAIRGNHNYQVIARLKPGADVKQSRAEMNTISARLEQEYPGDDKGWGAMVVPLRDQLVGDVRPADRPSVIVISQSMAKRFWPGENPIGKRLTMSFSPEKSREVVGVVGDVKGDGLDALDPVATLYAPLPQGPTPYMSLVVRTSSPPSTLVSAVSGAVYEVDRQQPALDVITMDEIVANSLSHQRFNMLLLSAFFGLALLLAAIGIYSVLAYSVRRRMREIGVRMALGAQRGDILRMILGQGTRLALIGAGIGIAAAFGLTRLMSNQLFGVTATDPVTFLSVAALIVLVALAACYIPARRATKVDPMIALRYE